MSDPAPRLSDEQRRLLRAIRNDASQNVNEGEAWASSLSQRYNGFAVTEALTTALAELDSLRERVDAAEKQADRCELLRRGCMGAWDWWQRRAEAVRVERDEWKQECWDCYVQSGADTDGRGPTLLNHGEALREVTELRASYDEAGDELARAEAADAQGRGNQ